MRRQNEDDLLNNFSWCNDVINVLTIDEYENTQELMLLSDCLITDYSSIFYDYLLLDRPIIFIPYDIEKYTNRMGKFAGDYNDETPGIKISKQIEFKNYISTIINNKDVFQAKRKKLCKLAHEHIDGNSSERVFQVMQGFLSKSKVL